MLRRGAALLVLALAAYASAEVPVTTVLADFEDDSVAAAIGEVDNVLRTACALRYSPIPARGQRGLALDVGVTRGQAWAACDLRLREPRRFQQADRVAAFCWIKDGPFEVTFRLRDAADQLFETATQTIQRPNRWVRIAASLNAQELRRVRGNGPLRWPIQVEGFRAAAGTLGKQTLFLDDIEVEHQVARRDMVYGQFLFDEPTRIYPPGATVAAALELENCSREQYLQVAVELAWTRPDGSTLKTQRSSLTLPASGQDFRSRQSIDFSQRIPQPGMYRLVARARAPGWLTPATFETSLAVTPSNRLMPRGRSTFFGVRADLVREPTADQQLEIAIARDIGVHLLAVEVPWASIEPGPGKWDFRALDPIVDDLVERDIVPLIVLTEPPDWSPAGAAREDALAALLTKLARHYGPLVTRYQPDGGTLPADDLATLAGALQRLDARLREVRDDIQLFSPSIVIDAVTTTGFDATALAADSGLQWAFRTSSDPNAARSQLEAFRAEVGFTWQPNHWWIHAAQPLAGPSFFADAEIVLHHYLAAAQAGVGGVIWYDLRDNDNEPQHADALRGLVRRDFSPKASLQGYASAAGMLTGLACRGSVLGTPAEYESALFVGSDRHVAVLLPKPNRVLPAVLAPIQGVPGRFDVRDFDRAPYALYNSDGPPLVPTTSRPLFISLMLDTAQPEPQVALALPWLRAPAIALCDDERPFVIEVEAPFDVQRASLRLIASPDAPFTAEPTRHFFSARQGELVSSPVRFASVAGQFFERASATLRVSLGGPPLDIPIEVRPLSCIAPLLNRDLPSPVFELAELKPPDDGPTSAAATLAAAYDPRTLHLLLILEDDRFVPLRPEADGSVAGDDLLLGLALAGAPAHTELRIDYASGEPRLAPLPGITADELDSWRCSVVPGPRDDQRVYHLRIPSAALRLRRFPPGTRLLLAARYRDDDDDGFPPTTLTWGAGLDGRRSSAGFHWCELTPVPP